MPGSDMTIPPLPGDHESVAAEVERRYGVIRSYIDPQPGRQWVALLDDAIVYLAPDAAGRQRLRTESQRLAWARAAGLPVPEVLDSDDDHLVVQRVRDDPPAGAGYVAAAVAACVLLRSLPQPAQSVLDGSDDRRGSSRGRLQRIARMARSPLSPHEFRIARRAAFALPDTAVAHGDFQPSNVLHDAPAATVHIVDWEMLRMAPAALDLLTLWAQLPDEQDRGLLLDAVLGSPGVDRRSVGVLTRWLAVRRLADLVTLAPGKRDRAEVDLATVRLAAARRLATQLGA